MIKQYFLDLESVLVVFYHFWADFPELDVKFMHLLNLLVIIRDPTCKTATHSAKSSFNCNGLSLFLEIGNFLRPFGHICLIEEKFRFGLHLIFCIRFFVPSSNRPFLVEFIGVFALN